MLVKQLFERATRVPVTVNFEQEVETSPGEFNTQPLVITGFVTTERDPFGTGDSPTEHRFEPTSITSQGEPVPLTAITDQSDWDWIENQAISQV